MPKKASEPTPEPAKTESPAPEVTESAAAKPIVATRRIITVSHHDDESVDNSEAPAPEPVAVTKKNRIEPLSAPEKTTTEPAPVDKQTEVKTTQPTPAKEETKVDKPADSKTQEAPAEPKPSEPTPAKEETKPADDTTEAEVPEAESGFTLDEGDEGQHPMDEAQSEADKAAAEKQEAINKLVEAETYFLPINSAEKRRVKNFILIALLFVVLAVAGAAWAKSAGYVEIPGL